MSAPTAMQLTEEVPTGFSDTILDSDEKLYVVKQVQRGKSVNTICGDPLVYSLPRSSVQLLHTVYRPQRPAKPHVQVLYAFPGIDKAEYAKSIWPSAYVRSGQTTPFWDGYEGQSVIVLDDYEGWLPLPLLERIVSCNSVTVPVSCGRQPVLAKFIFILTSLLPSKWHLKDNPKDFATFQSFVNQWSFMDSVSIRYYNTLEHLEECIMDYISPVEL